MTLYCVCVCACVCVLLRLCLKFSTVTRRLNRKTATNYNRNRECNRTENLVKKNHMLLICLSRSLLVGYKALLSILWPGQAVCRILIRSISAHREFKGLAKKMFYRNLERRQKNAGLIAGRGLCFLVLAGFLFGCEFATWPHTVRESKALSYKRAVC